MGRPVAGAGAGQRVASTRQYGEHAKHFAPSHDDAAQRPELDAYIDAGVVFVALHEDDIVGHVHITDTGRAGEAEIKNMAVEPAHQGRGVGRALIGAAVAHARSHGRSALLVATAAADIGNLRFYQRTGFRMRSIDRDAFTVATGYPPGQRVDGIELRDRVGLDRAIAE